MPVKVDIRINGHIAEQVHIGRIDSLYAEDQVSLYRAVLTHTPKEVWEIDWAGPDSVGFMHKYDDGLLVCVEKALEALRND